ncbi:hypothetical protein [Paracoccus sp. MC1862]|uniref:hypothetical protein n=1 Tax=Paracoccus sp. MC1862 TaxID=2760307 RepID=UPI00181E0AFB|nr:hypothetical protein [Paracoccus sp. MC1862]MBB1498317.1 hypothetical protein [Paracoccus sp. MC1862]QQO44926.1 hypothetical protein JGR78_00345 [Paracoccus sp. MC1862]
MSVPRPRIERPDDMGDVLAEIRRLVARGGPASQLDQGPMVVTARVTAGTGDERQRNPAQSLALSVELPMSGSAQPASASRTFPADSTSVIVKDGRQAPAPGPVAGDKVAPFRLDPDAMVPAAGQGGPLRLTPRPAAKDDAGADADADHPPMSAIPAPPASPVHSIFLPPADTQPARPAVGPLMPPAAERPWPAGSDIAPEPQPPLPAPDGTAPTTSGPRTGEPADTLLSNGKPDMQAHANSPAAPMHADPVSGRFPQGVGEGLPGDEENPLRALLREVVREEFAGELTRSLDDNLRRMVRAEIAAALTEALVRPPRG